MEVDILPRRVVLLPNTVLDAPFQVVAVPCPKLGTPRQVLLSTEGKVAELTRVRRPLGSWFIDESVEGCDGALHIASTIDPLFLVLPLLEQNADRFRPWTDIVGESDAAYGKMAAHLPQLAKTLTMICDCKEIPGLDSLVVRLNLERAFRWLLCKVDSVFEAVKAGAAGRSSMGTTAVARTLNVDNGVTNVAAKTEDNCNGQIQTSVDVICEYVSPQWAHRLYKHFGLSESKRDNKLFNALFAEQNRTSSNGSRFVEATLEEKKGETKKKELSMGQKRLRKVDTKGMASLSNFFPKKTKPDQEDQ